jgi:glutaredoxin
MSKEAKIYLYYKPNCPYSEKAKEILEKYNVQIKTATDKKDKGDESSKYQRYKQYLIDKFNYSTFPALILDIGINQFLIGGSDDIDNILKEQNKLLKNCQLSKPQFKKILYNSSNKVNLNSKLMCIFFNTLYNN